MPDRFGADYWRERADEARAQADQMHTESARKTLYEIAANYDQLAEQAERLRLSGAALPKKE